MIVGFTHRSSIRFGAVNSSELGNIHSFQLQVTTVRDVVSGPPQYAPKPNLSPIDFNRRVLVEVAGEWMAE